MDKIQIVGVVFYIFCYLLNNAKCDEWILFKESAFLNGRSCRESEIAFSKTMLHDKSACILQCVTDSGCKSVFHGEYTGDCVGCTNSYGTSNPPTTLLAGSKYFEQPSTCPSGWVSFGKSCYFIPEEVVNFFDGEAKCLSYNSHPVLIEDNDENSFLKEFINTSLKNGDSVFYTGFTDIANEGTWVEHGTSNQLTFEDWNPGEPNSMGDEDCLAFYLPLDLKWVDFPCSVQMRIVCEMES